MVINTNISARYTANKLSENSTMLQASLSRLSSGKKISSPEDDAAGLAQSLKLDIQRTRAEAAISNNTNYLSFLQTQDAISSKISKALDRMSELSILYADITKTNEDKANYALEFDALAESIYSNETTKFNGVDLFTTEGKVFNSVNGDSVSMGKNKLAGGLIGNRGEYNIQINYNANDEGKEFTVEHKEIFKRAAHRATTIIQGVATNLNDTDLTISAQYFDAADSDGVGGRLANAGATSSWGDTGKPASGVFNVDEADAESMVDGEYLFSTALHEILHIMGFGSGHPNFSGTTYNGPKAIEKYNELTGLSETSLTIENDGGAGTALAHWEEDIFDNEIMTGWSESGTAEEPMSEVTVAAFDDYGYEVKYDVADEWNGAGTGIGTTPLLISRVSSVKSAIQSMAETRAKIGSQITYTKNTIDALAIEGENLEKSVSKISDVDIALESSKFAKKQILVNSGSAMLAQANIIPEMALKLLNQ